MLKFVLRSLTAVIALAIITVIPLECSRAQAQTQVFKVRELSLDVGAYTSKAARDSYLDTPKTGELTHLLNLNWNVDLVCGSYSEVCFFWDNQIESKAGAGRFRMVGWEFESGIAMGKVDILYYHHSQHMMEQISNSTYIDTTRKYPVEDAVVLRLNFIKYRRN
jgi:hypothetical protein